MAQRTLKLGTVTRRIIVRAWRDWPDLQEMSFERLSQILDEGIYEERLQPKVKGCSVAMHLGATKVEIGLRIHGRDDPFKGATIPMNQALEAGHMILTPTHLTLPLGKLPESRVVTMMEQVEKGPLPTLGNVLDIDEKLSRLKIHEIENNRVVRFAIDNVMIPWSQCKAQIKHEIKAP